MLNVELKELSYYNLDFNKDILPRYKNFTSNINDEFIKELSTYKIKYSINLKDRIFNSKGQAVSEMIQLLFLVIPKLVDIIVYPTKQEDVDFIINISNKYDYMLVPFGAGTTTSMSLVLPEKEKRIIISVDMLYMNKIKWVDRTNMTACIEAGIVGIKLEEELSK